MWGKQCEGNTERMQRNYSKNLNVAMANSMSRFHRNYLDNYGIMKAVTMSSLWGTEGTVESQTAHCVWPWQKK